jgi:hypothetical protein
MINKNDLIQYMPMDSICCIRTKTDTSKTIIENVIRVLKETKAPISQETIIKLTKEIDSRFVDLIN